jgi:flagellar hook-associated protein 3 FlgL
MSISSINYGASLLGLSVQNINNQLTNLSTELSSGVKSTNYAGMGVNEGFAIAARSQLANISAFTDTMTNVNTIISSANTALQSLSATSGQVQSAAAATPQNLTSSGQTIGQQNAASDLSALVGILNTQVGNRYIFSGTAINTPAVASSDDILNGTATQAGLKQVISERQQADLGTGTGRLLITATPASPATPTTVNVAEDAAGSPFGLKLSSVTSTSSPSAVTVTQPSGSPPSISVNLAANPNPGDQLNFTFNLPDGTSESIQLTASSTNPPPTGSFYVDTTTPANTVTNLQTALTSSITTLANTSLMAASAVEAGDNFFNTDSTATGTVATNQASPPVPITGATALSGTTGTDSLVNGFANGDTLTVNGTTLTFSSSLPTSGNTINTSDSVQTLLSKIDQITGTSTPSTIDGGAVELNTPNAATFSITSSPAAALASLGFTGAQPITATQPPLRVNPSPSLSAATSLVNGSANTVVWYTGNSGPGSPRSTSTVQIDGSQSVQFGAQANEQAIRQQVQQIAVYAAVTASPTGANSAAEISALSQRVAANLTPQTGQQTIQDIQTDFANAQTTMQGATARQTQAQTALQSMISNTEGISQDQVASEILQLQNNLQASYQTTAMLSQLSLTKFLPAA